MRNIPSMCRDIERWEVNEVQIPGKKIEPQWLFLDTLVVVYDVAQRVVILVLGRKCCYGT